MWVVNLGDNTRHSAWLSKAKAMQQAEVLEEHGHLVPRNRSWWRKLSDFVEYDETTQCENGHYYV